MNKHLPVCFFRANKDNKGATLQIQIKPASQTTEGTKITKNEGCVYFVIARQVGDKKFDYDNKITMKLSAIECSEIILGIKDKKVVDLVHKLNGNTSSLKVEEYNGNFGFKLFKKTGDATNSISIYLSLKECNLIIKILEDAMTAIYTAEDL